MQDTKVGGEKYADASHHPCACRLPVPSSHFHWAKSITPRQWTLWPNEKRASYATAWHFLSKILTRYMGHVILFKIHLIFIMYVSFPNSNYFTFQKPEAATNNTSWLQSTLMLSKENQLLSRISFHSVSTIRNLLGKDERFQTGDGKFKQPWSWVNWGAEVFPTSPPVMRNLKPQTS